ncbi:DUF4352 domain-containing protein [Nocardia fusca]|uniref:DUF4352 domain-containing protein n=1 Tax=Nocardia fusca TaxID=941183 RepID=UPI0037C635B3
MTNPPSGQWQQPGYGQPHYPPPGPRRPYGPPRRGNNNAAIIILAVFGGLILFCGGCVGIASLTSSDEPTRTKTTTTTLQPATQAAGGPAPSNALAPAEDAVPGPGTPVRDGQFEFRVTAVDPPVSSVGSGILEENALGEFIVVHVDVTNTGDEPRSYFDSNQKLFDDRGREFANDSQAGWRLDSESIMLDLNPGFTIQVAIVFDVPVGTVPAAIEFHDSMLSGGATVALR